MRTDKRSRSMVRASLGLAIILLGPGLVRGQETKEEKEGKKQLADIKRYLPPKGPKETTWYVLQLQTRTSSTSTSGSMRTTTVSSDVKLRKVQGQDEAAKVILDFLKSSPSGTKNFYQGSFPDTEYGIQRMEKYMEQLRISGKMNGYSPTIPTIK